MRHLTISFLFLLTVLNSVHAQSYVDITKEYTQVFSGSNCQPFCHPNVDFSTISKVDRSRAEKAFNYIARNSGIEFNYPQGGCPERALAMHYMLDSMNISNFRIWLFSPYKLKNGDTTQLFIADKNHLIDHPSNQIIWPFHVAPCILSESASGNIDTLVFDPSINSKKLLTASEWMDAIGNNDNARYAYLDGKYYSFNNQFNSTALNGYFFPYSGFSFDSKFLEKMLALNDVAMILYKKYIKSVYPNNVTKALVRQLLGNSATFYEVLKRNDGIPAYSKLSSLVQSNPSLMREIWALHDARLMYWIKRMKPLIK